MRLSTRQKLVLFGPLGALLSLALLLPAAAGLVGTFTSYAPGVRTVRFTAAANYLAVLGDRQFLASVRNVAVFTALAVPLELVIGFGLAWLLLGAARRRSLLRVLALVPWLVSPIGSGVMWHYVLGPGTGLPDFVSAGLGLGGAASPTGQPGLALLVVVGIEAWRLSPLAAFLLFPGLAAVPAERWEQASLDGATLVARIRHVALPSMWPLLLAVTMLLLGAALGAFDPILVLTGGGPGSETLTPALYSYSAAFQVNDWPRGTAAAWLIASAVAAAGLVYVLLARRTER